MTMITTTCIRATPGARSNRSPRPHTRPIANAATISAATIVPQSVMRPEGGDSAAGAESSGRKVSFGSVMLSVSRQRRFVPACTGKNVNNGGLHAIDDQLRRVHRTIFGSGCNGQPAAGAAKIADDVGEVALGVAICK